jgi:tRNA A37 threonylcarbamoyladenosine synthetase subunit TsaC/SUA5/YrdC
MKTETVIIKKVKKDGSVDEAIISQLIKALDSEKISVLPIDGIYGCVSIPGSGAIQKVSKLFENSGRGRPDEEILISSFKMLETIIHPDKWTFDFLHRLWPGELIMNTMTAGLQPEKISIRMPRSKFCHEIIEQIGKPLRYIPLNNGGKKVFRKKNILDFAEGKADHILIIEEFCKQHASPTIVDITDGKMSIIKEGRIPGEEIKSLYFLGQDDSEI